MFRVVLQSRLGNIALAVAGVVYVVAAVALLVWHASTAWGASGLKGMLVNLVLAGTVVVGAWIVANSAANLGVRLRRASR